MQFDRYAVFFTFPESPLADFGASWLGWDISDGVRIPHPEVLDIGVSLVEVIAAPRRYGFHATIKPPFQLAPGKSANELSASIEALCRLNNPVVLEGLQLSRMGGFLALTPVGDTRELNTLAGKVVQALDTYRAPMTEAEFARRNHPGLNPQQKSHLGNWGYPFVLDQFRFHVTLTGKLGHRKVEALRPVLETRLASFMDQTLTIDALSLVGEDTNGYFHTINRHPLNG